jgi:hypothetical protein
VALEFGDLIAVEPDLVARGKDRAEDVNPLVDDPVPAVLARGFVPAADGRLVCATRVAAPGCRRDVPRSARRQRRSRGQLVDVALE